MLNDEQEAYCAALESAPEKVCACGWYWQEECERSCASAPHIIARRARDLNVIIARYKMALAKVQEGNRELLEINGLTGQTAARHAISQLAGPDQWGRLADTVYSLRGMLDGAGFMKRADVAILSDALGILRELLLRRPVEFGGPRECR